jgi:hypothetical protein
MRLLDYIHLAHDYGNEPSDSIKAVLSSIFLK